MLIPYSAEVALIKLAGYTVAGAVLRRVYGSRFNYLVFGLLRFVAGSIVWIFIGLLLAAIIPPEKYANVDSLALLPERIIVWVGLIFVVFQVFHPKGLGRFCLCVLAGIGWSYCLDGVVALLRWLIPSIGTTPWC